MAVRKERQKAKKEGGKERDCQGDKTLVGGGGGERVGWAGRPYATERKEGKGERSKQGLEEQS